VYAGFAELAAPRARTARGRIQRGGKEVASMNTLAYAWRYVWARPMAALLNVLLLSLGLGSITFLLLVSHHVERAFDRDLAGIDAVVGAKGSPMQLILSGVLHLDVPPGNVPLAAVNALKKNPLVAEIIPISLGDNLQGYRIVGTSPAYLKHYQATLAQGHVWDAPMQVVLGATVARTLGLQLGQQFAGSHGLGAGGHAHGEQAYNVVGVLAAQGGVIDRLIITDTASVWNVHESAQAVDEEDRQALEDDREITMALVRYNSPLAAVTFPRWVNTTTAMQAAAPALEVTRLLHMLGLGTDVLRAFAGMLLLTAGLSVFIALWNAVRERQGDLALLRMLGAPASRISVLLMTEALWLALLSALCGLALGQAFVLGLGWVLGLQSQLLTTGLLWPSSLWVVPALAALVALCAAVLPVWQAYRSDVLQLLQSKG
jgi:putative ABC transport system permease protein